jgi:hypothetical protein
VQFHGCKGDFAECPPDQSPHRVNLSFLKANTLE